MTNTKDPAFLLYSSDFLIGCAEMSNEEIGQYIRILCYMHQKGRLSEETICKLVGSVLPNVRLKFRLSEDGRLYNERFEAIIEERRSYVQSRRLNGAKGGRKKENKQFPQHSINPPSASPADAEPDGKAKVNHMEDENENINEDLNEDQNNSLYEGGPGETKKICAAQSENAPTENELYTKGISSTCGPPLQEVSEYFQAMGYKTGEAKKFWDYYEGQGWITGGTRGQQVKNWRAKVDSFVKNIKHFQLESLNKKEKTLPDISKTKIKLGTPIHE